MLGSMATKLKLSKAALDYFKKQGAKGGKEKSRQGRMEKLSPEQRTQYRQKGRGGPVGEEGEVMKYETRLIVADVPKAQVYKLNIEADSPEKAAFAANEHWRRNWGRPIADHRNGHPSSRDRPNDR